MITRKMLIVFGVALLCTTVVFAQSGGSFSYATTGNGPNPIACTMDTGGNVSGGYTCQLQSILNPDGSSTCTSQSGACVGNAVAGIQGSSGGSDSFEPFSRYVK